MSEVKSAKDLASAIKSAPISMMLCSTGETTYPAAELIQSDRRAIIEKCREWTRKQFHDNMPEYNNGINDAINILDSVLSEIEKEE